MSASLHLGSAGDIDVLLPLVAAFHKHVGIERTNAERQAALTPLLRGTPHGVVYMIGPRKAPVGYIAVSFGYSIEFGGINGTIDEFFIRSNVRGRGMGSEVLTSLMPALSDNGVTALHLKIGQTNRAEKIYARAGFRLRVGKQLMSKVL